MLGMDAWMHAATRGDDWVAPLRESAQALNARSLLLWGPDIGAGKKRYVGTTTHGAGLQVDPEFVRICGAVESVASADVLTRPEGGVGQLTWTHVLGTSSSDLALFALSDAPLDRTLFRATALLAANAVAARSKLQAVRATSALKTAAFDQLSFGIVIVDGQVRIVESNAAFGTLLTRGDGLSLVQEKLLCREPGDQLALSTAVGRALAGEVDAAVVKIHRAKGAQPYVLRVVAAGVETRSRDHCLLMIVDPDEASLPGSDIWRAMFDLTECELIIAEGLVSGRRINEIANERGVSIETVRSQTKRMFERLNVSSQAEAAARLSRTAPFRPGRLATT